MDEKWVGIAMIAAALIPPHYLPWADVLLGLVGVGHVVYGLRTKEASRG